MAEDNDFTYSEVGLFRFEENGVYDDSFTAVDQDSGDCTDNFSNQENNGKVGCQFGNIQSDYIGRFTPHHFAVQLNTPELDPSSGSFTYIGQSIAYSIVPTVTVTAENNSGDQTRNYTGNYWKIEPNDNQYGILPTYTANHTVTSLGTNAPMVTDNGDGTGVLTFGSTLSGVLSFNRNAPEAPFNAEIQMSFNLIDTDSIVVESVNDKNQSNPVIFGGITQSKGIAFTGSFNEQRWGQLGLQNNSGSELAPLTIPVRAEYYDGANFVFNADDNQSDILTTDLVFRASNGTPYAATPANPIPVGSNGQVQAFIPNSVLSAGQTEITLSDANDDTAGPGKGNVGYVDIDGVFTRIPWLIPQTPVKARATFGIQPSNTNMIYFKEVH